MREKIWVAVQQFGELGAALSFAPQQSREPAAWTLHFSSGFRSELNDQVDRKVVMRKAIERPALTRLISSTRRRVLGRAETARFASIVRTVTR